MKAKRRKLKITIAFLCAAGCVGGVGFISYRNAAATETEMVYKETTAKYGTLMTGVTESGSVTIGTVSQEVDYESSSGSSGGNTASSAMEMSGATSSSSSSASLEVEEVYVTVGQYVNEGDAILKLSDESISEYRSELTEAVSTASASLTSAEISSAKQELSASYTYTTSVTNGSVAEANYNATITELQNAVDDAKEALDEQYTVYSYYSNLVASGQTSYSDALEEAKEKYSELTSQYVKAQNNYTTKSIEAKKTYEEALLASENASAQYASDINGIDNDVDDAKDTLSDAKEALAEFEEFVGDGVIYAEYSGMVTEIGYEAGDTLSSSTAVASYTDDSAVSITVSVSEEDIADIAVGDAVSIALNAYEDETFDGVVSSMNTTTSSGSSTVSYSVTVLFTGDVTKVYADMTGNVTFIDEQVENVVYVSKKAVVTEDGVSYVKVKDADGNITKVEVTTGFTDGVYIEISSGVSEGDTVLIESQVSAA